MNVLLTSCGRRAYLVRYFKEALKLSGGGEVHCVNSDPVSPCAAVCDRFQVAPAIYDEKYIDFLLDYCRDNSIDAIVSLFDIDLPVLARARDRFSAQGVTLVVSDEAVASLVSDKYELGSVLSAAGIGAPVTARGIDEAVSLINEGVLSYPVVVKPRRGTGSIETYVAENEEELRFFHARAEKMAGKTYLKHEAAELCPGGRILVQEFIKGDEYGLDIVCDLDGNYAGTLSRKKIRMRSGETDACVTVRDESINETGAKIAKVLASKGIQRGPVDADVIVSGGKAYVIDVNARFGGGYPFSHNAGANVPLAIVKQLKGEPFDKKLVSQETGVTAAKAPETFTIN